MKARSATLDVAAQGSAYLRLWFNQYLDAEGAISDVYLCLNDESGRTEDCFHFRLSLD